jgi:hypothetical protein
MILWMNYVELIDGSVLEHFYAWLECKKKAYIYIFFIIILKLYMVSTTTNVTYGIDFNMYQGLNLFKDLYPGLNS